RAVDEGVERSQQGHPRLPPVRTHRFEEWDVLIMDIPLISVAEVGDVNPVDGSCFLQLREGPLQVQVSAAWKVQVDLAGRRGPEGTDGPLRLVTLDLSRGQRSPVHLA